jgi:HAD superfamily hydrolase (TIGR01544 family)
MPIDISALSFEYRNSPALAAKIARFSAAGSTQVHVVLDFDRTLTVAKHASVEATSWQVMERQMPPAGKAEYGALFDAYRRFELDGALTTSLAEEWWNKSLALLTKYAVDLNEVEATFLDTVALRPGATELFAAVDRQGIPAVILSAGVKDIITILLTKNGITPPLVISTELTTNTKGIVTGWQPETVVHVLNKSEVQHDELDRIRRERPLSIIIGDSLDDAHMAIGEDDVLRIRVIDPRADEQVEAALEKTFQAFDLAVLNGNLNGVVKLIEGLAA